MPGEWIRIIKKKIINQEPAGKNIRTTCRLRSKLIQEVENYLNEIQIINSKIYCNEQKEMENNMQWSRIKLE